MTEIVGPVTSEVAVEIAAALPALGRLIRSGVASVKSTSPTMLSHLGGVPLVGAPDAYVVGLARPEGDRVDEPGSGGHGWVPIYSRHPEHQGHFIAVMLPGHLNACVSCLLDLWLDHRPELTTAEEAGLASLITAVAVEQPIAPIVGIDLGDLAAAVRDCS